ncbi:hypothetical protein AB1283_25970 [Bacillus sp. S13(2024)]|uniref:hypothetical protein n=1 Tax=Bacillus sp. S13(2024) TaxID=3162885 RepID=UPI003D23D335
MENKDYERLAILETELKTIGKQTTRIEQRLDDFLANFATRKEVEVMFEVRDEKIVEIKKELEANANDKKANISIWISGIGLVAMVLFSILNFVK